MIPAAILYCRLGLNVRGADRCLSKAHCSRVLTLKSSTASPATGWCVQTAASLAEKHDAPHSPT